MCIALAFPSERVATLHDSAHESDSIVRAAAMQRQVRLHQKKKHYRCPVQAVAEFVGELDDGSTTSLNGGGSSLTDLIL
jgi:hypothetical protein